MDQTALDRLKSACGTILVGGQPVGTAFVAGPQCVATCWHLFDGLDQAALSQLRFHGDDGPIGVSVLRSDPVRDCAILQLARPPSSPPLTVSHTGEAGAIWTSYGFPEFNKFAGYVCKGEIRDANAVDARGVTMLQLYSDDLAAALGQPLHGMSGAPIVSRGVVIGVVRKGVSDTRFVPTAEGRSYSAAGGLIYATAISTLLALLGESTAAVDRRDAERVQADLQMLKDSLEEAGPDVNRIEALAERCVKFRYAAGLVLVREHQLDVAKKMAFRDYARALGLLGVAHYVAGRADLAERAWRDSTAVAENEPDRSTLLEQLRRLIDEVKKQPPGALLPV